MLLIDCCNSRALLKRHMNVHSGNKEFQCLRCAYATSHKSNLERHVIRLHGSDAIKDISILYPKSRSSYGSRGVSILKKKSSSMLLINNQKASDSNEEEITSHRILKSSSVLDLSKVKQGEDEPSQLVVDVAADETDTDGEGVVESSCSSQGSNKSRLCPKPYKCFSCHNSFETQTEYACHSYICTLMESAVIDHPMFMAALALTQMKRAGSEPNVFTS